MNRYFKVVEIDEKEFEDATMEELEGLEVIVSAKHDVYVAVDEAQENDIVVPLDCFE